MPDRLGKSQLRAEGVRVVPVAVGGLYGGRQVGRRLAPVEDGGGVPALHQAPGHVPANESGAVDEEEGHGIALTEAGRFGHSRGRERPCRAE